MGKRNKFSGEVRERAVRLVMEQPEALGSQCAAIRSVAEKLGCGLQDRDGTGALATDGGEKGVIVAFGESRPTSRRP